MSEHGGMPPEAEPYVNRIKSACDDMLAIVEEVEALERRIKHRDVAAIHLGVRRIAEALLRHACRVEGAPPSKEGPRDALNALKERLQGQRKDGLPPKFWRDLEDIIRRVNPNAHFQDDDVYIPVLRRLNPVDEIVHVVLALAGVAEEFVHHWPPPKLELPAAPHSESQRADEEPAPERTAPHRTNSPSTSGPAAPEKPSTQAARPPLAEQLQYGAMNVAQAREDQAVRDWLATHSDLQQRGVSRRLNAEHGRCKLRNVFPSAFPDFDAAGAQSGDETEQAEGLDDDDFEAGRERAEPRDGRLDYLVIGRLTVAQARELDVAEDIATITGYSPSTVKSKLRTLHGSSVIHRQFPWFTDEVVGEMTVSTALRYEVASFLPAAFGDTRSNLLRKLRLAPGQTKLKNLFAQLGGSRG
jgi:hypothetical protein